MAFGILALALLATSGCAATQTKLTPEGATVVEADFPDVVKCKYLEDVIESRAGLAQSDKYQPGLRNSLKNLAATKGASHIVWTSFQPTGLHGTGLVATAKLYKCKP